MVGARSSPQRLPASHRRSRPRVPIRLPFALLIVVTLLALVLAQHDQHNARTKHNDEISAGADDVEADVKAVSSTVAAATASPKEATQQALELLRTLRPPSSRQQHAAKSDEGSSSSSSAASQTSLAALSPYWDLLTSWSPLGTVLRLGARLHHFVWPNHVSRGATWEGGASLYAEGGSAAASHSPYVLNRAGEEHEELLLSTEGARLWPAWEQDGWTGSLHGPFLCSAYAAALQHEQRSYTDRIVAALARPVMERLPTAVRKVGGLGRKKSKQQGSGTAKGKGGAASKQRAADQRRREALALLTYAAGFAASPDAAAQAEPEWRKLQEANVSLSNATIEADADALYVLATLSQHGMVGTKPNVARAKAAWSALAAQGNATAHTQMAWFSGGAWHGDAAGQPKALLHYHLAARAGDQAAQMTLGYRYKAGIGVQQSCSDALQWYEAAAKQAYARYESGPPGGLTMPYAKQRLSDAEGGVYGPGASAASTGLGARRPAMQAVLNSLPSSDPSRLEDLLEFYTHHAARGHAGFALRLAHIWYGGNVWNAGEGAGRVGRDFARARAWALRVTEVVWPMDSKLVRRGGPAGSVAAEGQRGKDIKLKTDESRARQAAVAAAMIGRMFLRGEGVETNYNRAWVWFQRAAEMNDSEAYNGIGLMYRDGLGLKRDMKKAVEYFEASANQGTASSHEGSSNLAKIYMDMGDLNNAAKYFEYALKLGSPFEAYYHLAAINARLAQAPFGIIGVTTTKMPIGPPGTPSHDRCRLAVAGYKYAVERGDWHDPLFARAEGAWARGDKERALELWAMAGERGYEAAQNNVAWILDRDKKRLRLPSLDEEESTSHDRLALIHWTRSAAQDNVDALVKVGDYYFHGIGLSAGPLRSSEGGQDADQLTGDATASATAPASSLRPGSAEERGFTSNTRRHGAVGEPAYEKAAACYAAAADRQESALAFWNMGWLYECGLGVPQQDFHLAKRYYDMAVEVNQEAYLPVTLSLIKLHAKALWATLAHADSSAISLLKSYAISPASADGGAAAYTEAEEREALAAAAAFGDGRRAATIAEEQAQQRRRLDMGEGGDPNLPETYDVRRRATSDDDGEVDPDMRMQGGSDEDLDDIIEGAMIVLGLAALAFLVYVRQGAAIRAERERREGGPEPEDADDQAHHVGGRQMPRAAGGAPDPPFPWPPEGANVYAGL